MFRLPALLAAANLTKQQKLQILEQKLNALDIKIKELRDMKRQIRDCMDEL